MKNNDFFMSEKIIDKIKEIKLCNLVMWIEDDIDVDDTIDSIIEECANEFLENMVDRIEGYFEGLVDEEE